jgi:H+/gluconate symporter-like permease
LATALAAGILTLLAVSGRRIPSLRASLDAMHRIAVIGAGALDIMPHNGAVITLLAVCGRTHRENYLDIVMVAIVSSILALVAVILLGGLVGSL